MKIALIGYGKMGRLIDLIAVEKGHQVVAKISRKQTPHSFDASLIEQADVCIDFSHPECAVENIAKIAKLKKNLVMGTSGWYDKLDTVKQIVSDHDIGFLYSSNFSLGGNLFLKIVAEAAALIDPFQDFDVGGYEAHHNQKVDSPSGTAKSVAQAILDNMKRKKTVVYDKLDRPPAKEEIHFPSLRCGHIPGTHSVFFDSPCDSITLTHEARNREGFARGAVVAAEWLKDKKGFYTFQDII